MTYFACYDIHIYAEYIFSKHLTYVFHITTTFVNEILIDSDKNVLINAILVDNI